MKNIKKIITFIVCVCFFNINGFAKESYVRTNDNLLVPNDVVVDNNNINSILKTPAVDSQDKIYDYANIFSEEEEKEVCNKLSEFLKDSSIDALIVTTNDLLGMSISEYANNFYDYNDFLDEGVIFVIYMNESEPEIYMGNSGDHSSKVFRIYTDSRINQTLEYIYKNLSLGEYSKAINDYINILDGFYRLDENGNYKVSKEGEIVKSIPWMEIVILSFALTFIIIVMFIYNLAKKSKINFNIENKINSKTLMVKTDSNEITV